VSAVVASRRTLNFCLDMISAFERNSNDEWAEFSRCAIVQAMEAYVRGDASSGELARLVRRTFAICELANLRLQRTPPRAAVRRRR
jgi:hypothetical protein